MGVTTGGITTGGVSTGGFTTGGVFAEGVSTGGVSLGGVSFGEVSLGGGVGSGSSSTLTVWVGVGVGVGSVLVLGFLSRSYTPPVPDLNNKVALVTGAASGMGAACAQVLHGCGAQVVIVDLDGAKGAATAASLDGHSIAGDISDSTFCDGAIAETVERYGRLDVLVNAAGTMARKKAVDTDDATWQRVTRINLDGTFYMCRAALRQMQTQGGGAIVNFSSIWGLWAGPNSAAYSASKGGVSVLTRALALDHGGDNIRVNAVLPGDVDTPLLRAGGRDQPLTDEDIARMGESIPIGRVARPDEIANVVAFLASDDASYITGVLLPVDGGYSAQ